MYNQKDPEGVEAQMVRPSIYVEDGELMIRSPKGLSRLVVRRDGDLVRIGCTLVSEEATRAIAAKLKDMGVLECQ